jgi:hypothetical protein
MATPSLVNTNPLTRKMTHVHTRQSCGDVARIAQTKHTRSSRLKGRMADPSCKLQLLLLCVFIRLHPVQFEPPETCMQDRGSKVTGLLPGNVHGSLELLPHRAHCWVQIGLHENIKRTSGTDHHGCVACRSDANSRLTCAAHFTSSYRRPK